MVLLPARLQIGQEVEDLSFVNVSTSFAGIGETFEKARLSMSDFLISILSGWSGLGWRTTRWLFSSRTRPSTIRPLVVMIIVLAYCSEITFDGLDDRLQDILPREAAGDRRQVRADRAALVAELVALDALRRLEHFLAAVEAAVLRDLVERRQEDPRSSTPSRRVASSPEVFGFTPGGM
jgi:hypothetical protein